MKLSYMVTISLILFTIALIPIYSAAYGVDIDKLPKAAEFKTAYGWLEKNEQFVERQYSDWSKIRVKKEEIFQKINVLFEHIGKDPDQGKADVLLYKTVLLHYSYNLGVTSAHEMITSISDDFKARYPKDYRIFWIAGRHYALAGYTVEAIKEFEYALNRFDTKKFEPLFWYHYGEASGIAAMFVHGIDALQKYSYLSAGKNKTFDAESLFNSLQDRIIEPEFGKTIKGEDLYAFQHRESGYGMLCRLFGIYLPFRNNWGYKVMDCMQNASMIFFQPGTIRNKNDIEIAYSIAVSYNAKNPASFEEFKKANLKAFLTYSEKDVTLGNYPFAVYEITDPTRYTEMGGFHGYALFLERKQPKRKGIAIEAPNQYFTEDIKRGLVYIPPKEYNRFDGPIFYFILLDTCEDIFDESFVVFKEFVGGMKFD